MWVFMNVNQCKYLDNYILSTESNVNIHIGKAWTAINWLMGI